MKTADPNALAMLRKAPVADPVIAGDAHIPTTSPAEEPRRQVTKSLTIRMDADLIGKLRAAYHLHLTQGEVTSFNAWMESHLSDLIDTIEQSLGYELEPVPSGILPPGPRT